MPDINGGANQQPASWRNFIDAAGNSETRYPGDVTVDGEFSAPGVMVMPTYVSGRYYLPLGIGAFGGGGTTTATATRFVPIIIPRKVTIDRLGGKVITPSAGGLFKVALYRNDPVTNLPTGLPIVDSGDLSTTTAGNIEGSITPVTIEPGLYWSALQCNNATATFFGASSTTGLGSAGFIGSNSLASFGTSSSSIITYTAISVYGTWPDMTAAPFSPSTGSTNIVAFFRVA